MSLLSFGEILIDFLSNAKSPEAFTKYPGGAPANVAVAFSKLGGQADFVGKISTDMFGVFLRKALTQYRVNTKYCRLSDATTALAFVSLDESNDRSFTFYRNQTADLLFEKADFDEQAFKVSDIFHFCSNTLVERPIFEATLHSLKLTQVYSCICSFDVNLRLDLWNEPDDICDRIWSCIQFTHLLKLSNEELAYLIEESSFVSDKDAFLQHCFHRGVKLIAVTNGENAVEWYTPYHHGKIAPPKVSVKDTTAAGDAFMGALLFSFNQQLKLEKNRRDGLENIIKNKNSLNDILKFAIECGSIAVQRFGAFPSFATSEDISFLSNNKSK